MLGVHPRQKLPKTVLTRPKLRDNVFPILPGLLAERISQLLRRKQGLSGLRRPYAPKKDQNHLQILLHLRKFTTKCLTPNAHRIILEFDVDLRHAAPPW